MAVFAGAMGTAVLFEIHQGAFQRTVVVGDTFDAVPYLIGVSDCQNAAFKYGGCDYALGAHGNWDYFDMYVCTVSELGGYLYVGPFTGL